MKLIHYISFFITISFLISCSGTKGLAPKDKLLKKTKVNYTDKENITSKSKLYTKVKSNLLEPNSPGIFNIKTGFYNSIKRPNNKLKNGIKNGIGSKPVVFNPDMIRITERRLEKTLIEDGYIRAQVQCDSIINKRKASIECDITVGPRYTIDSVFYIQDTLSITKTLRPMYNIEFTKSGDYYQISNLLSDRDAFVKSANNNGFPFVNLQDVIFFLDTLAGVNEVDIHMRLRPNTDSLKYERFRYGGLYINPNYSLENDNPIDTSDMLKFDEYNIVEGYDFLGENALNKAIFIKEGNIFNQSKRKITIDRFQDFGLFKFVNVKTLTNKKTRTIDHFLNLTTHKMESLSGEMEINNRQGNFWGLAGTVTYSNKNVFKSAARFDLSLSGGMETQFESSGTFVNNNNNIKLQASLTMPNVVTPLVSIPTNRNFIPKTYMSLSGSQERRVSLYSVRSANVQYGFKWNETNYKTSFLKPLDLSWLVLFNTTTQFDTIDNPELKLSLQTTLLPGMSYVYEYNKRNKFNPINQTYFSGTLESSGNILSLLATKRDTLGQKTFLGTPYAQYVRFTVDVRKFWDTGFGSIGTKLLIGTGFAYYNSKELPYSKQYSIGGANSLRAFRLRTLGPGSFVSSANSDTQFIDQTGDIKIESSIEYRFPILGFFKGAVFVDAGNVWLFDSDEKPEGVFSFDTFTNQIALGSGFGLRFDFEIFLFRLDIAFPVRDIMSNGDFDWVIKDVDPFSSSWRKNNLIYNIGIGYPF